MKASQRLLQGVQAETGSSEPQISELSAGTVDGAAIPVRFVFADSVKLPLRERLAALLVVSASILWILVFICCDVTAAALPWCVVLLSTALGFLAQYLAEPKQYRLSIGYLGNDEPASLRQSIALCYAVFSIGLCLWLGCHHSFQLREPITAQRQVIDIELVSKADFEDRKDILPSTKEKATVKERHATAEVTEQSKTPLARRVPIVPPAQTAKSVSPPAPQHRAKIASNASFALYPMREDDSPRSTPIPVQPASRPSRIVSQQPMLEEVAPPEMVELTDNQGDKSSESFQSGGRSKGGSGAPSALVFYLKELHRRIKHAWTPPFGETRSAEILFRLKRNGKLSSIKLVASSGDSDADSAAMHAIAACAPFKALPADYPADYLDLQYTFNYKADQLSEVADHRTE
jgi:TonB family protein